jgi:uncharacterized protein (TIGR03437 family)
MGFARNAASDIYFADSGNNKIRVIRKNGAIELVAGTGVAGSSGDGSAAINAQLNYPVAVTVTGQGEIYVAEAGGNRVRKILADGTIQTVAGDGQADFAGDGGQATQARINGPKGIVLDSLGNLYISDTGNHRVRRVAKNGTIQTVAGSGPQRVGQTGDGQPALTGFVERPTDLAVGPDATLYIASYSAILRVTPDGTLHYVTSGNSSNRPLEGKPANQASAILPSMALDAQGAVVFLTSTDSSIWKIAPDGTLHYLMDTYLGSGLLPLTDGTIIRSALNTEQVVRYTPGTAAQGTVASNVVIAGQASRDNTGDGGPGTKARMDAPLGIAADSNGNIYIADAWAGRIRKVDRSGRITTIAGTGGTATPDGAPALKSVVNYPTGIAVNSSGEVFYTEIYLNRVRKIKTDGTVITVAGNGNYPGPAVSAGDPRAGGKATSAAIHPDSIAVDGQGSLYISDSWSSAIWLVTTDGTLKLLAGNTGPSVAPLLSATPTGTVYFLDFSNSIFRFDSALKPVKIKQLVYFSQAPFAVDDSDTLYMTTGSVLYRYSAAGIVALTGFGAPALQVDASAAVFDPSGNLFIADFGRARVVELPAAKTCLGPPVPFVSAVVNSAGYTGVHLAAPGEIIQIFGTAVGPETLVQGTFDSNGSLPTTLAGTQVIIDGTPAPLLYSSSAVTAAIVPFSVGTQDFGKLQVFLNGILSNSYSLQVLPEVPGIFTNDSTGGGQGAILNQDYSRNSSSNPARKGTAVSVYATGFGAVSPPISDGVLAPDAPSSNIQLVTATVDNESATVLYAGTAPGLVAGVTQVNVVIPQAARSGNVPIMIRFGDGLSTYATQPNVTVAIQ